MRGISLSLSLCLGFSRGEAAPPRTGQKKGHRKKKKKKEEEEKSK